MNKLDNEKLNEYYENFNSKSYLFGLFPTSKNIEIAKQLIQEIWQAGYEVGNDDGFQSGINQYNAQSYSEKEI